jgi:8-oxo-dGTP diphosphatase
MDKRVHVAVAVITDKKGRVLIAKRPEDVHQGGLWEFPGGKVEDGENTEMALRRELSEEIGILLEACEPLLEIYYDYPDKAVLLDVYRVFSFSGEAYGREQQAVRWVTLEALEKYAFPEANRPILEVLPKLLVE